MSIETWFLVAFALGALFGGAVVLCWLRATRVVDAASSLEPPSWVNPQWDIARRELVSDPLLREASNVVPLRDRGAR